jgi:molybdopterin converting factor small subunit
LRVKVYAASFCSFKDIDTDGYMELPDGSVLNDVYKKLLIPLVFRKILFATVNYQNVGLKTELHEGDVVSLFSGLGGG